MLAIGGLLWVVIPPNNRQAAIELIPQGDQPRVVFVLFDLSGSARSMGEKYTDNFDKILSTLKAGDRLIVDSITDNPLSQSTFPINEKFKTYGIFDRRGNPIFEPLNQKDLDEQKTNIKEKTNNLINNSKGAHTTAILDALQLAERVFNTYANGEKILVVFSDMLEVSKARNFNFEKLAQLNIDTIIEQQREAGELPNLNGVRVYVIGAGAGEENRRLKAEQWFDIQNFWLAYFTATGADLTKDRYGAALLEF
ncbi:MAG: hypothetical protein ABH896_00640 [Candidatus Jacksonbacteria bacterium]